MYNFCCFRNYNKSSSPQHLKRADRRFQKSDCYHNTKQQTSLIRSFVTGRSDWHSDRSNWSIVILKIWYTRAHIIRWKLCCSPIINMVIGTFHVDASIIYTEHFFIVIIAEQMKLSLLWTRKVYPRLHDGKTIFSSVSKVCKRFEVGSIRYTKGEESFT